MTTENYGYDYTSPATTDYFGSNDMYGYDYTSPATNNFWSYITPPTASANYDPFGEGTPDVGFTSWQGGSATSGGNPITELLGSAWKSFSSADPKTQSALITVGGSFLAGFFGAKGKDRLLKTQEKTADASMLNAQTAQKLADSKVANQGAMGRTTFGKPRPGGIMSLPYDNKLAKRQANPGASGLIGAA